MPSSSRVSGRVPARAETGARLPEGVFEPECRKSRAETEPGPHASGEMKFSLAEAPARPGADAYAALEDVAYTGMGPTKFVGQS